MALTTYMIVTLAILVVCWTGFGSGLRIVSQPQPFTFSTKELNISCISDEPVYVANSILNIQILRHIEDRPIAVVNIRKELKMAVGIKDNVKAQGHIGIKSNTSYLTLIIDKPDREDAGPYRCQMFYMDENFQMVEKNVIGNVTYQEQDITRVVKYLAREVSSLQTKVIKQNKTMQAYSKQHGAFRDFHSEQKVDIDILNGILNENMEKQNNTDMKLMTQMNKQNKLIEKLNEENTKKQKRLDMLIEYIADQNKTIQKLQSDVEGLKRPELLIEGWKYYEGDRTFIKVFGKDDRSKWLSWSKARETCQTYGGDLVQIHDDKKNTFVYNMANTGSQDYYVWIGIKNEARVGYEFHYVDGSDLGTYHPWVSGDPNGAGSEDEKCVWINIKNYVRKWGEYLCSNTHSYACSVPSFT